MFQLQDPSASSGLLLKQPWRWGSLSKQCRFLITITLSKTRHRRLFFLNIKIHFLQIYFWIFWKRRYQPKWKWVVSLDGLKLLSTKSIIIHRNTQTVVTHHSWYKNSLQGGSFRWSRSNIYVCYYVLFFNSTKSTPLAQLFIITTFTCKTLFRFR